MQTFDLEAQGLRALNQTLHDLKGQTNETAWEVVNPKGSHAIAVGVDAPVDITVRGSTGYYCAGHEQAGDDPRQRLRWPRRGRKHDERHRDHRRRRQPIRRCHRVAAGLLVIKGNASSRCGISMKGIDIVVHGNIGHMSCFMAQSGNILVLGDAGDALGDSLYEAHLFVRGTVKSLGTDCIEKEMRPEHLAIIADLLKRGEADHLAKPSDFKRYGSARKLYTFNIDNASSY